MEERSHLHRSLLLMPCTKQQPMPPLGQIPAFLPA